MKRQDLKDIGMEGGEGTERKGGITAHTPTPLQEMFILEH
jgi:hypothetical protein